MSVRAESRTVVEYRKQAKSSGARRHASTPLSMIGFLKLKFESISNKRLGVTDSAFVQTLFNIYDVVGCAVGCYTEAI